MTVQGKVIPLQCRRFEIPAPVTRVHLRNFKSKSGTSTTLADLFTPRLVANPFSAMRTSLRWWSSDEFEDGVAYGWQSRLGRWPVDSFFPALLLRGGDAGGRHMRSSS